MNKFQFIIATSCLLLSGCTPISVVPVMKFDASPQTQAGYISARISGEKNTDLAFVIHNVATGIDYNMPLGGSSVYKPIVNQISTIEVPPGRYVVASWITFATLTKDKLVEKAIDNPVLKIPFVVKPKSTTFIGDFSISYNNNVTVGEVTMSWRIHPLRINTESAHRAFVTAYPAFRDSAFSCRLCVDTIQGILHSTHEQNLTIQ